MAQPEAQRQDTVAVLTTALRALYYNNMSPHSAHAVDGKCTVRRRDGEYYIDETRQATPLAAWS